MTRAGAKAGAGPRTNKKSDNGAGGRASTKPHGPSALEIGWSQQGWRVGGVDEVGRGCLAGPVYAACVVLDHDRLATLPKADLGLIRDSKTLSAAQRARILPRLHAVADEICIGIATVEEIDSLNILQATFVAMRRALAALRHPLDLLVIDGKQRLPGYQGQQEAIIDGDALCMAVAAASIVAKEARDAYMRAQDLLYPVYGFAEHVGYGTASHRLSIAQHGICPLHRRSFAPIRESLASASAPSMASSHPVRPTY